ncbi:hypothetical protein HNR30_007449 [Nonomuraea soli]|uniref:Uncharacterized protein n=1 Tax=Nonomuraea soli TaxID=1032476 RepID=A0A7W0CRW2_9ACTN|nr:hypothetical protein [Nonomuraea soli]
MIVVLSGEEVTDISKAPPMSWFAGITTVHGKGGGR